MAYTGKLHVPTAEQILRLAYVASASFYHSPANAYERPDRDKYPQDTLASYANELFDYLTGPDTALLVIEDTYKKNEEQRVYAALRDYMERESPASLKPVDTGSKIIVGFVGITFNPGTGKHGFDFKGTANDQIDYALAFLRYAHPHDTGSPSSIERYQDLERDRSAEGASRLSAALAAPMKKHLAGQFTVDMIAVHPAYWRRGHGITLLKEAAKIADKEKVPLGVAAVAMGVKNCERTGFKECEVVEVKGYSQQPESFKAWIGIREPSRV